ncbi:uncharacterized protein LOC131806914 isoform X1 [Musca domestica]|uniref:Uncharacterized protein LOC131806914 isoform X1 n=1 Tax=Musca domestica TaxID=7370 RepID=A0ABM3VPQ3_MUSDO|nr:uncharacterized protein LOC131806914 isoform X1 [Musca domestica]
MASRHNLYKLQSLLLKEVIGIKEKLQAGMVRKAAMGDTLRSLESKMKEATTNHEMLRVHGENTDPYFKENVWDLINLNYGKAKELLASLEEEVEREPQRVIKEAEPEVHGLMLDQQLKAFQEEMQQQMQQQMQQFMLMFEKNKRENEEERQTHIESSPMGNQANIKVSAIIYQFRKKVNKLADAVECDLAGLSKYALEYMKSSWEKHMDEIRKLHLELSTVHGMEEVDLEFEEIEEKFESKMQDMIRRIDGLKEESLEVELKRVQIPSFSGHVEEWSSFHDLFKKMIDENSKLSKVQKLYYLKTNLKGEAFRLVQHLQVTEANYEAAWELLEKRYGNRRILFTKLVDRILDHQNINSLSAISIRNLLDNVNESIQALKAMDIPLEQADPILARIIIRKLDKDGLILYEQNVKKSKDIQKLEDVMDFLEQQFQALEASVGRKHNNIGLYKLQEKSAVVAEFKQCKFCKMSGHDIAWCRKFSALSSNERYNWARSAQVCLRCLSHNKDKKCYNEIKCQKCGMNHITVMHLERRGHTKAMTTNTTTNVLLATAQVRIKSLHGEFVTVKALIDQGSQITSISEDAAQLLQLPRKKTEVRLQGLGETLVGVAKSKVALELRPRFLSNIMIKAEALVLPALASAHPDRRFQYDVDKWRNVNLADPNFNSPERIDLVIGADLYSQILEEGVRHDEQIVGQNTKLGWILSGTVVVNPGLNIKKSAATTTIERFWEIEEIEDEKTTEEDEYCLKLYEDTTRRDNSGRFVVRLPLIEEKDLGDSYKRAMARFINLEKRLENNAELKSEYEKTMNELISMGQMVKVDPSKKALYYMPHQAVVRETSLTTKVRVVFDASSTTSNGKSLNDILHVGPRLQKDIFDIVTKWRSWKFVISADVEKMFRQIKVEKEDQEYQHVLWRSNPSEPIQQYKLTTVTYGTASAPFLAVRSLIEIGNRCQNQEIAQRIKEDFYMDDLLTGANTKQECREVQKKITLQLEDYGFHLRKWISNSPEVLSAVKLNEENEVLRIEEDECLKTLGLQWNPQIDCFTFSMQIKKEDKLTKRIALSRLAQIFDPLGWLTPVTVTAKLFIQQLWIQQIEWDVPLEEKLSGDWRQFTYSLPALENLRIPRWFGILEDKTAQLHGFADASEKAYAAVVYLKVNSQVTIVAAKSKVNPVKNRKTLPKLELCATHLLAKLLQKIKGVLKSATPTFAWSDSMISLAWIHNSKNKDKFIKTRVMDILERIPEAKWGYVKSKENPADMGSRGVPPETLTNNTLWWEGPEWLKKDEQDWPKSNINQTVATTVKFSTENHLYESMMKYSSFKKQIRVMAYLLRFIKGLKKKRAVNEHLTAKELEEAEMEIIKLHQEREWPVELRKLKTLGTVDHQSKIASLHPQLDRNGIMRVGGRLALSELNYNQKHPIIIQKSRLAGNIIRNCHIQTMHGGNRLMENILRRKYWIIGAKNRIKLCIRCCPRCTRFRGEVRNQLMGNLPAYRVSINQPFQHCGIDYAGPLQIRCSKTRGVKAMKGYVAVFVCMVTKAVHLEAVSELTTEAFLAALRRFFARRGKSTDLYSDNGTNFVGAARQLDRDFLDAVKNNTKLAPILENEKISWHFIPPAAPHVGGIWEAAVKSMKYHLKRIIGDTKLTYEELSTVLSQIEAVLNSRPLHELGSGTEYIDTLTPGHFLIGRPMLESPATIDEGNLGCLNRWKLLQRIKSHFWSRWKEEYLTTLQNRMKWKKQNNNVEIGNVVILKNEETHAARWPLAKVVEVHPGKDGVVRIVTVKTQDGVIKRPINKLCPLEHMDEESEELPRQEKQAEITHTNMTRCERKIRKQPITWAMMLNLFLLISTKASSVHELNSSAAVYLDPMSQIHMVSSSWNMVVYFELKPYLETLDLASELLKTSKSLCPRLQTFEEQCWSTINNMELKINKIKTNNRLFLREDNRQKRGAPLKFVGSFQHWAFGIMDDDDRVAMESNMKNLLANQKDLKKLAKQQTSVVDATVNLLRKTTEEENSHFSDIKGKIENISATMNENYFVYRESIRFFIIAKQIHELLEECDEVQKEVVDALIDVNSGKFHPVLITPKQLQAEIVKIRDALPEKYVLPGKRTGMELKEILHLMTCHGSFVGSQLVINIKIPLFNRQSSQFYKVIPIPFEEGNTILIARVNSPYIVYNFELDSFHFLTQPMLNECKETLGKEIMCEENFPWRDATTNNCELSPLRPHIKLNCAYDEVERMPYWMPLKRNGNWLFKTFSSTTAHLQCSHKQQTIMELPKQGILTLDADCTARIGKDVSPDEKESIKPLGNILINHHQEIDELKKFVDKLKKENVELRGLKFHHISSHVAFILVIIVIIILIILFIRRQKKLKRITEIQFPRGQDV